MVVATFLYISIRSYTFLYKSYFIFNSLKVSSNTFFADDKLNYPQLFFLGEILKAASKFYKNWDKNFAKKLFDYFEFNNKQLRMDDIIMFHLMSNVSRQFLKSFRLAFYDDRII